LSLKIRPHKVKVLEEGPHKGKIVDLKEREVQGKSGPVKYLDCYIQEEKTGIQMKYGCPLNIGVRLGKPNSKLARLLVNCGIDINKDEVDLSQLKGRTVQFMVQNEETDRGVFSRILDDTVKKA